MIELIAAQLSPFSLQELGLIGAAVGSFVIIVSAFAILIAVDAADEALERRAADDIE